MRIDLRHAAELAALATSAALAACAPAHVPIEHPAGGTEVGMSFEEAGIRVVGAALANGAITSRGLTEHLLARIDAFDRNGPRLNALIHVNPLALDEAAALDRERAAGNLRSPLHGIPIVIKDNYDTHDMPTTAGSRALAGSMPPDDAFQVARLRAAGVVIVGKTNMHELAYGITTISSQGGQTRNPYDPARNPGGSSGGTSAAIAAGFAIAGLGSDTCGSIRFPAAHTALAGIRPTMGLSSRDGIVPLSLSQDVGGPLARHVEDLALLLDATVGYDVNDPVTSRSNGRIPASYTQFLDRNGLRGARIGVLRTLFGTEPANAEVNAIVERAAADMAANGAELVEVAPPELTDLLANSMLIANEFPANLRDYLAHTPGVAVASLDDIVARGLFHPAVEGVFRGALAASPPGSEVYQGKVATRAKVTRIVEAAMDRLALDALLYPPISQTAAKVEDAQGGSGNCRLAAATGLPAIVVPAGYDRNALPVGVELLGRAFAEGTLLRLGYAYEQATHHRRPPASTPPLR